MCRLRNARLVSILGDTYPGEFLLSCQWTMFQVHVALRQDHSWLYGHSEKGLPVNLRLDCGNFFYYFFIGSFTLMCRVFLGRVGHCYVRFLIP